MLLKTYLILFLSAFSCAAAWGPGPPSPTDPIADKLFPPELVMQYRQEIELTETQTKAMKDEIRQAQAKFLDMQWNLESETEKLVLLLKAERVDESATLAQLDKVLDREREIKKTQISLLVRIKNLLTPPQQNKLMELRGKPL